MYDFDDGIEYRDDETGWPYEPDNDAIDEQDIIEQPGGFPIDLTIKPEQLPMELSNQVKIMSQLNDQIELAKEKVQKAKEEAAKARHKIGFAKKKKAIEELQIAVVDQSEALVSEDEAIRLLFSNQKKLANISQGLLVFGIVNMANNRTVYQQLKDELTKASESEINEHAKAELKRIIEQLKVQEDIYNKIERHSKKLKELDAELVEIKKAQLETPVKMPISQPEAIREVVKVEKAPKGLLWLCVIISVIALTCAILV